MIALERGSVIPFPGSSVALSWQGSSLELGLEIIYKACF